MIVHHGDLKGNGNIEPFVILACNDCTIKVIDDSGQLIYQTILDAAPNCITLVNKQNDAETSGPLILLYGLQNGNIGAVELSRDEAVGLWELDCNQEENKAPVSHLKVAQLKDNQPECCILVREDSYIEIYKFTPRQNQQVGVSQPALVFQTKDNETITGCVIGHVTSAARSEILFTCYSGAIKSLVDRRQAKKLGATTEDTSQVTDAQIKQEKTAKLSALQSEVAKLEQKVALEEKKVDEQVQKQKQIPKQASNKATQ